MSARGKHGEPWDWLTGEWQVVDSDGVVLSNCYWESKIGPLKRSVACVNALDGLEPSALGELIEAAEDESNCTYGRDNCERAITLGHNRPICPGCRISRALRALRGEP